MTKNYRILITALIYVTFVLTATPIFAYQNPTVNAGPDLYLSANQSITLQGSAYDQSNYYLNYYWYCNGGTLSNNNIAQPIFTPPYSYLYNQNSYVCTLTVTNPLGNSGSDNVTIFANYNNTSSLVQTNSATYISNYQATLNGSLSSVNSAQTNYVYFQWGQTTSYGNETPKQLINYSGSFTQNISSLNVNTIYHYRAVLQNNSELVYGQDITFITSGTGQFGNGLISIDKKIINLNSNNRNWASEVVAKPLDTLVFAITIQPNNQNLNNVTISDILPAGLIYRNSLMVNTQNYTGDINSGINIGTVYSNQPTIISYQVQVAPDSSFIYGITNINTSATISSNEIGTQTRPATVTVNKSTVLGASTIPTGVTNNPLTDSFFIPLSIILSGMWLYFSGNANRFAYWIKRKI